jgi:hypothetical protein
VAVVEDLDGIKVCDTGGGLDLALEAAEPPGVAGPLEADEVDGAGPMQQNVLGQVDLPIPPAARASAGRGRPLTPGPPPCPYRARTTWRRRSPAHHTTRHN